MAGREGKGREGDRKRGRVTASKPRLATVSSIQHTHIKHNEHQLKCKITQKYTTRQSRRQAEGRGERAAAAGSSGSLKVFNIIGQKGCNGRLSLSVDRGLLYCYCSHF